MKKFFDKTDYLKTLLLQLNQLKEATVTTKTDEIVQINIDGGSF